MTQPKDRDVKTIQEYTEFYDHSIAQQSLADTKILGLVESIVPSAMFKQIIQQLKYCHGNRLCITQQAPDQRFFQADESSDTGIKTYTKQESCDGDLHIGQVWLELPQEGTFLTFHYRM
jgi:hypothetical protein